MPGLPAVFLDKDGTLVDDVPYNVDPALVQLLPGVREGLAALRAAGYRLVLISNQSGVARGRFAEADLPALWAHLESVTGQRFDGIYYCPHHPAGSELPYARDCDCRKPAPGLLLRAAHELSLDLARSWFVGDILNDVEAGRRAGCRTVLLDNGGETEWLPGPWRDPHFTVHGFADACAVILEHRPSAATPLEVSRNS